MQLNQAYLFWFPCLSFKIHVLGDNIPVWMVIAKFPAVNTWILFNFHVYFLNDKNANFKVGNCKISKFTLFSKNLQIHAENS